MRVLGLIAFAGILFLAYVRFLERSTVFLPSRALTARPGDLGLPYRDVFIPTADGPQLHGWLIAEGLPGRRPLLIFHHGNAGNIADRLEKVALFHGMGLDVFIFDYRGYGRSEGRPTEKGFYVDALAAYDFVVNHWSVPPGRIVLYGASLGGAAAVEVAAARPAAVLILDSTFTDAADMARTILPWIPPALLSVRLDNLGKIRRVRIPKLFLHSEEDEVVPYRLGRALYAAAPPPKRFVTLHGAHNDGWVLSREPFEKAVRGFLRDHGLL